MDVIDGLIILYNNVERIEQLGYSKKTKYI